MARINIEDKLHAEIEFKRLVRFVGDEDKAVGLLYRFWRQAQDLWGEGKLMPKPDFEIDGFTPILEAGLAVERGDEIYAKGAEERFAWYRQKVEAGKKRAESERDENGRFKSSGSPAKHQPSIQRKTSEDPAAHQLLTPSPSLSPALIQKKENTNTGAIAPVSNLPSVQKKSKFSELTRHKMRAFIEAYAQGYREKYKSSPDGIRDKALLGKLGHWIEGMGEERAVSLVQVYLQVDYKPINDSYHDLWMFFRHLNRISNALDTGKDTASIDWGKVFA